MHIGQYKTSDASNVSVRLPHVDFPLLLSWMFQAFIRRAGIVKFKSRRLNEMSNAGPTSRLRQRMGEDRQTDSPAHCLKAACNRQPSASKGHTWDPRNTSACGVGSQFSKQKLHQVISKFFGRKLSPVHAQ